jgi:hypothetical protein
MIRVETVGEDQVGNGGVVGWRLLGLSMETVGDQDRDS